MKQETRGGDEWSTPRWLFDFYDLRHDFTLDAAASEENHKVTRFFTREENALLQSWKGERVWCNPPYSDPAPWVDKAIESIGFADEADTTIVMLLPSDSSTRWFSRGFDAARKVEFLTPRIRFGGYKGSPRFGSVVMIFGFMNATKDVRVVDLWRYSRGAND